MPETAYSRRTWVAAGTAALAGLWLLGSQVISADRPTRIDPAAWGSDHVGKPMPDYVTGDECLFCHREKVGTTWSANRHNLTIRAVDDKSPALVALKKSPLRDFADEVQYVMGDQRRQRFLKPSKDYGKLELLSVEWAPPQNQQPATFMATERPHWDGKVFAESCAGCHATAVDPKTQAFSAFSLDCFVCHGNVPLEHSKKRELAHLSPKREGPARVAVSICAQCHVRTGKSKSTGRPYPTNFVAGDNLFRDFQVDFSDAAIKDLSSADRHVLENVREVVVFGQETVTCLSCHDVHGRSSKKHARVPRSDYCLHCHHAEGPKRDLKPFSVSSKTCGY